MDVSDSLMAKRLIEQALTNWVNPELERRKTNGKLTDGFILRSAQVLFSVDGTQIIRLNEEVKAVVKAKINRKNEKGEQLLDKDVDDIHSIRLLKEESDFGHITILRLSKGWFVGFSFLYDVSKSKGFYDIATEFMKSANYDLEQKRYRPFIESLFVAVENLCKARITLLPDEDMRKIRVSHRVTKKKIGMYSRTSNVIKTAYSNTFVELLKLRDKARYDPNFSLKQEDAEAFFKSVTEQSKDVIKLINKNKPSG